MACNPTCHNFDIALRQKEWDKKYPNGCHACGGSGVESWTENGAPHGAGYWPMDMQDVCSSCVARGCCPLCAYQHGEDWEGEECRRCGWTIDGDTMLRPEYDFCYCGLPDDDEF